MVNIIPRVFSETRSASFLQLSELGLYYEQLSNCLEWATRQQMPRLSEKDAFRVFF